MNSTKTDDRDQWRARILRALDELQPTDKVEDCGARAEREADSASAAE